MPPVLPTAPPPDDTPATAWRVWHGQVHAWTYRRPRTLSWNIWQTACGYAYYAPDAYIPRSHPPALGQPVCPRCREIWERYDQTATP